MQLQTQKILTFCTTNPAVDSTNTSKRKPQYNKSLLLLTVKDVTKIINGQMDERNILVQYDWKQVCGIRTRSSALFFNKAKILSLRVKGLGKEKETLSVKRYDLTESDDDATCTQSNFLSIRTQTRICHEFRGRSRVVSKCSPQVPVPLTQLTRGNHHATFVPYPTKEEPRLYPAITLCHWGSADPISPSLLSRGMWQ